MRKRSREYLPCALLAVVVVLVAGCGSWRNKLTMHKPLPGAGGGVPAELSTADALIEQAVRAVDRYAEFPQTLYHAKRKPQLYKEVRVLYGASLDTFPSVLGQWLGAHGGTLLSARELGRRDGEEPYLLIKVLLRVPAKVVCWLEVRRRAPASARLAIIVDDAGLTRRGLETAQALPRGICFSVLPYGSYAREVAEALHASGHMVLLHQPMEPLNDDLDTGPGAIRVGMDEAAIRATVVENLAAVPHVVAVNNHMGSKATADEQTMRGFLLELKARDLPFVDSVTSPKSVCGRVATELGVRYVARNAVFLDNSRARKAVRKRLRQACRTARVQGAAITIGHFCPSTLEVLSAFDFGEVELVPVTQLIEECGPVARASSAQ